MDSHRPGRTNTSKPKKRTYIMLKIEKQRALIMLSLAAVVFFSGGFFAGRWSRNGAIRDYAAQLEDTEAALQAVSDELSLASVQLQQQQSVAVMQEDVVLPWNLLLINAEHPLDDDYLVPELTTLSNGHAIDMRAYPALQEMMDDARVAGLDPLICSSFRTEEKQEELFNAKVQSYLDEGLTQAQAQERAAGWVQRPGTSEHQMALAVDLVDASYQLLDEAQEETPVQVWLMEHCDEYGFILRYPTDKSDITGVNYEPWHYRYVGVEAAQEIMERGICLEEYILELQQ